jgi:hypothetical protein
VKTRLPPKSPDNDNGRPIGALSSKLQRALVQRGLSPLSLRDLHRLGPQRLAMIALSPLWTGVN